VVPKRGAMAPRVPCLHRYSHARSPFVTDTLAVPLWPIAMNSE
jgi:hypothetical protein